MTNDDILKSKEVLQQAKELKKVHIFKFMCYKLLYWQYKKALKEPKLYSMPDKNNKNYILTLALNWRFNKSPEENKQILNDVLKNWEKYYKNTHGYLAVDALDNI